MSWSYLFLAPTTLPLTPATLSEETTRSFTDADAVRAALDAHLPHLAWAADPDGALARGVAIEDGVHYEFVIRPEEPPALIVSMRTSGRADSAPFVQRLCDATGWIAFDDRVYLFQPHQPPVPAGGG